MTRAPILSKPFFLILGFVMLAVACGGSQQEEPADWGSEAVSYYNELAAEYRENDFFGVLDFYTPTAFIEKWRGDLQGGLVVPELLRWNSGNLGRAVQDVYLGSSGSVTVVDWQATNDTSAIFSPMEDGRITGEVVFDLASSLERNLRSTPELVASYTDLYTSYITSWSRADSASLNELYEADATVVDQLQGVSAGGLEQIVASSDSLAGIGGLEVPADSSRQDSETSPAIYLGGSGFGVDPGKAVGLYQVTNGEGCTHRLAVLWRLQSGKVVSEERFHEVDSFATCREDLPDGWWTGLTRPPPPDEVSTGELSTPNGRSIEVRNGVPILESTLLYGMETFASSGLDEPEVTAVVFQPSRKCVDRSGRIIQSGDSRVLYVCLFESDICPPALAQCDEKRLSIRATFLHELAHAWILDHVDEDDQNAFLELTGLSVWQDPEVPWPDRGVEYAAEVVSWGLLNEPPSMVRIGNPPCATLKGAFELLTGMPPLHDQPEC